MTFLVPPLHSFGWGFFFPADTKNSIINTKTLKMENYNGKKYNKLTIIKDLEPKLEKRGNSFKKRRVVLAECECGNTVETMLKTIKNGKTKSCGKCRLKIGTKNGYLEIIKDL